MQRTLLILLAVVLTAPLQAANLTGAVHFSAGAAGEYTGGQLWNTVGGDGLYNLYLIESGSPVNSGNGASTSPNFALVAGNTYVFEIRGEPGANFANFGLNLMFDGLTAPSISVFRQVNGGGSIAANSNANTGALTGATVAGSGVLSFVSGADTITLTDYSWFVSPTAASDAVNAFNNTPSGANDFIGSFTLEVTTETAIPEPATLVLLAAGLVMIASMRRL
jgi:hypothetical protein